MLRDRGIRKGIQVWVKKSEEEEKRREAMVINTYPHPSSWLIVQYDDGTVEQVEENQVTTMFEENREKMGIL